MGLDMAAVTTQSLDRPDGAAYDFAWHLASECETSGEGNAFGWFIRSQLHRLAADYIQSSNELDINWEGQNEILDWIESLPFEKSGYISLHFNW